MNAGEVKLSDSVSRFYPEIRDIRGSASIGPPVTFLQIATMTSGLAAEPRAGTAFDVGPVSQWEKSVRAALLETEFTHLPGTHFAYSNIGYAILGAALARAAGMPYIEWQRTHLLDPLGMHRTQFEVNAEIAGDLATGYVIGQDGRPDSTVSTRELITGRGYRVPNGAIFTTIDDLSRFLSFELGRGPETVLPHSDGTAPERARISRCTHRDLKLSMTHDHNLSRQFQAELDRIGVSDEARCFIAGAPSLERAVVGLRTMPTELGTDGFFRELTGADFATWKAEFERQFGDVE